MPRRNPPTFRSHRIATVWKLMKSLGEDPVAIKVHPDGSFRVLTAKCLAASGNAAINPNEWDVVLQ